MAVRLLFSPVPQEGSSDEPHGGPSERPPARVQPLRRALRPQVRPHQPSQGARVRAGQPGRDGLW